MWDSLSYLDNLLPIHKCLLRFSQLRWTIRAYPNHTDPIESRVFCFVFTIDLSIYLLSFFRRGSFY